MSEINRVALKSLGANSEDGKKKQEVVKTVRISLRLPVSNEDTCPEFNYKEELAAAKRKEKMKDNKAVSNFMDPFMDDEDDVRRIAQQMEAKYGATVPSKKKRKSRKDDYADIGAGYDESDSFIDNTDGYDEMIPQNVTTLHGGFYINSGALEFKTDDEASSNVSSSSSSEDEGEGKPSRKRKIISSDESEGENETENPEHNNVEKKPKQRSVVNNGKIIKKKFISKEDVKIKKNKLDEAKKLNTVKELLIEEGKDLNVSLPVDLLPVLDTTITDSENEKKENKKPMSLDNVNDAIESVIKSSKVLKQKVLDEKNLAVEIVNVEVINNNIIKPENSSNSDLDNSSNDTPKVEFEIVKLPENLPNEIISLINNIKDSASNTTEGRVKVLAGPVGDMLLNLERKFKCLGKQSRNRVYEHLAPFLKCKKETIMKRAKNLVLIDDKKKIEDLLARLKICINKIMPPLLENYKIESQKIMQKKFSKETIENEEMKHLRMPKRRFSWTEEIKKLFKEIVLLRKRCFLLEGKNKLTLESQMETFLKTEVQVMWPDGWMSMHALLKLYCNFSETSKQSKSINLSKKTLPKPIPSSSSSSSAISAQPQSVTSKELQKIASNSTLSIIPVSASKSNAETSLKNDVVIDKIIANDTSSNKIRKSLPNDIHKTSTHSLTITPTSSSSVINVPIPDERKFTSEPKKSIINEVIIVEEKPKKSVIENVPNNADPPKKSENKHCQIIDLTENVDLKRKFAPKSKKHLESDDKAMKQNEGKELTASSAYNNLIQESLCDLNRFAQNLKSTSPGTVPSNKLTDHSIKKLSTPSANYSNSSIDHLKVKGNNEGDDIKRVMEGLKALQNMATPAKTESATSSPVSVISFNKSHSKTNNTPVPAASFSKSEFNSGYQEAFQRQLFNDFHLIKGAQPTPTSSKSHFNNSIEKYPHSNNINYPTDKYLYQSPNNNFAPQNTKINQTHQAGSYNVLDDMLTNFLNDYGYPKSANHKQKSSHSHK